jgi:hypothetical protein
MVISFLKYWSLSGNFTKEREKIYFGSQFGGFRA